MNYKKILLPNLNQVILVFCSITVVGDPSFYEIKDC